MGAAGVNVSLVPPLPPENITAAARYYLAGSLNALDVPGEFYINRTSGATYYYPQAVLQGDAGVISGTVTVNKSIVDATGLVGHTFVGLVFEAARGDVVHCYQCQDVHLVNCTVQYGGGAGVVFDTSNDCSVVGTTVTQTGGKGVSFTGGGNRTTLTPSGNLIQHSTITWFELACFTYNPGVLIDTGGVVLSNEVAHSPHAGLMLSGNDVLLRYNIIHDTVLNTFDNAALYWFPVDWTKWNVTVDANFWYLNGWKAATTNQNTNPLRASVYMDNAGAGLTVSRNVIWMPTPVFPSCKYCTSAAFTGIGIMNDGGRSSKLVNNIVVDTNGTFNGGGMLWWDKRGQNNNSAYYDEMRAVHWDSGLYAERYPDLALLHDYYTSECADDVLCPAAPWNNSFAVNVLVNCSQVLMQNLPASFPPSRFNLTLNLLNEDPHFVEADPRGTLNFQLRDDSPAYALGFTRIPMECFGPWKC